jgi:hypothetical protein
MQTPISSRLGSVLVLAAAIAVASPARGAAQGGTGTITVRPNFNTTVLDGFTVCTGTSSNRALYGTRTTGTTGVVTFTGIPANTQVVTTVTKTGFIGREAQWTAPASGGNTSVTVAMSTGSGGWTCPTVTAPTTSSVQITVNAGVNVARDGFHVCVGTAQNRAQYGSAVTPASGTVTFTNLPASSMITATAVKSGYFGASRDWYPTAGQTAAFAMNTSIGSGGSSCPGYSPIVRVEGTTGLIPIAPDPPRLGLELLQIRGDPMFTSDPARYSCSRFGSNYVMVGLKVRHLVTRLTGIDLFCAPLRADGTLGTTIFLPATTPDQGTPQEVKCPAGQAVAGYRGMTDTSNESPGHIRSIVLYCAALKASGLTEGTPIRMTALGIYSGSGFGPDMCTGGRPAREMRLTPVFLRFIPTTIGAWQMGCEQPVRPSR